MAQAAVDGRPEHDVAGHAVFGVLRHLIVFMILPDAPEQAFLVIGLNPQSAIVGVDRLTGVPRREVRHVAP